MEAQVEVVAWVEVQAGIESGRWGRDLVWEGAEYEIQVGPCSSLEVVFGAMAESLCGLHASPLFGAFLETDFLFEAVF